MGRKITDIMILFASTLNQTAYLFTLIIVGYLLTKLHILPENSSAVLSKLETWIFIPMMVFESFSSNFAPSRLSGAKELLLVSTCLIIVTLPIGFLLSRIMTKDSDMRKTYYYNFVFPNSGFMGYAVVKALFPELFFEFVLFCIPYSIITYLWAIPALIIPSEHTESKPTIVSSLKSLCNPMFVAMIIGMLVGLSGIKLPVFFSTAVAALSASMSPIAMLITGVIVGGINLKRAFTDVKAYITSIIRLIVIPLAFIMISWLLPLSQTAYICIISFLAMPIGLNTIVIPSGYGKDTSKAAGMIVISHLLGCITIPLLFLLV